MKDLNDFKNKVKNALENGIEIKYTIHTHYDESKLGEKTAKIIKQDKFGFIIEASESGDRHFIPYFQTEHIIFDGDKITLLSYQDKKNNGDYSYYTSGAPVIYPSFIKEINVKWMSIDFS